VIKRRKSDDFFFRLLERELIDIRGGEDEKKDLSQTCKEMLDGQFFFKAAVVTYRANVLFIYYYLLDWFLLGL
jgi:hypothetical protein